MSACGAGDLAKESHHVLGLGSRTRAVLWGSPDVACSTSRPCRSGLTPCNRPGVRAEIDAGNHFACTLRRRQEAETGRPSAWLELSRFDGH
jgi:hypothetical protein